MSIPPLDVSAVDEAQSISFFAQLHAGDRVPASSRPG